MSEPLPASSHARTQERPSRARRRGLVLFRPFGFPVRLDPSWLVLALLVTWTLAVGVFRPRHEELAPAVHWWMAVATTLGLFVSIVLHELAHAIVARRHQVSIRGITLFIFGGVSEMEDEPRDATAELRIAAVGPLASFALAGILWGLHAVVGATSGWWVPAGAAVLYLAQINLALGIFNLVPGFPLDGGRILRAALWSWKYDLRHATRVSSAIGSGIGLGLIVMGIALFVLGAFVAGIWWFLIGSFLRQAAKAAYRQLLLRQALADVPVERLAHGDPVTASPDWTVARFVEECVLRHQHRMYPVLEEGRLLGMVTVKDTRKVQRDEWGARTVRDVMESVGTDNSLPPGAMALDVLRRMTRNGRSRLLVRQGDRLVGVVTLRDLLRFFALKTELEGDSEGLEGEPLESIVGARS